jgi:hypothetical protein
MISNSIRNQSKQIFQNIEILFNEFSSAEFDLIKGGFLVWKQFYHLVHSIDKNFLDPTNFVEPNFHKKNLDIIFLNENHLSKEQIFHYYEEVKEKISRYLTSLDDNELEKVVMYKDMQLTKMELILAQFRHIFYHVGYMQCFIKIEKGQTPEYIGLYKVKVEQ